MSGRYSPITHVQKASRTKQHGDDLHPRSPNRRASFRKADVRYAEGLELSAPPSLVLLILVREADRRRIPLVLKFKFAAYQVARQPRFSTRHGADVHMRKDSELSDPLQGDRVDT